MCRLPRDDPQNKCGFCKNMFFSIRRTRLTKFASNMDSRQSSSSRGRGEGPEQNAIMVQTAGEQLATNAGSSTPSRIMWCHTRCRGRNRCMESSRGSGKSQGQPLCIANIRKDVSRELPAPISM